jgi:gamma-glutamylcyclotransferase (GGCT)/AIG2-like uncharacterized protein YtfP
VPQAVAVGLVGEPAPDDGLAATTVDGPPDPDEWPTSLFVYGTLQPGHRAWPMLAGDVAGRPRRATVTGQVYDTGLGYPALLPGGAGHARGWLVPLRDPAGVLARTDRYEGAEYRRIRLVTSDGAVCWSYAWAVGEGSLAPLAGGWTA